MIFSFDLLKTIVFLLYETFFGLDLIADGFANFTEATKQTETLSSRNQGPIGNTEKLAKNPITDQYAPALILLARFL
jgi:hypothetical protein